MRPGRPLATKRQAVTEIMSSPIVKHMRVDQEENQDGKLDHQQATEASNRLEYVATSKSPLFGRPEAGGRKE